MYPLLIRAIVFMMIAPIDTLLFQTFVISFSWLFNNNVNDLLLFLIR